MSGIVVTKSSPVLVVPSPAETTSSPAADTTTTTVPLSSFDKCVVPFPVTALLAYDRPIHNPAETVKNALARALAHYRPLAGRLAADDGELCLACTDEGVTFVSASASSAMELEAVATSAALLKDLAVYYPGDLCRAADPLLLVQVTEFACGGFVVAVTWNHVAADGAGMAQFLQAVGEAVRGASPPSVPPVRRWDDSLPGLPASMVAAQKSTMDHAAAAQDGLAHLDVAVPASLVRRVKAEAARAGGATVFEAVTAVLWWCRTRAAMASSSATGPESLAPLAFPCNMRAHAGAADGYYGNCVAVQMVPATKSAVAAGSVADLVTLIRRAKEKAPDILSSGRGSGTGDGVAGEQPQPQPQPEVGWYDAIAVVSWRNLGFDKVDLGGGGGGPARVTWYGDRNVVPGCVVCPPPGKKGDDDGAVRVSTVFLKPEHVDAFLWELASLATST